MREWIQMFDSVARSSTLFRFTCIDVSTVGKTSQRSRSPYAPVTSGRALVSIRPIKTLPTIHHSLALRSIHFPHLLHLLPHPISNRMFVMPMQPNTVIVSVVPGLYTSSFDNPFHSSIFVPGGCCKAEFDATFPAPLNGIITPDEFRESIGNINATSGSRVPIMIAALILAVSFIAGVALVIAGGVTAATSGSSGFPVLVGVGMGVLFLGMIVSIVVCCVVQVKAATRLQEAIAQESAKYTSRSSKSCSWRLNTISIVSGTINNRHNTTVKHVRHPKDSG